jgi:hypothetical protein
MTQRQHRRSKIRHNRPTKQTAHRRPASNKQALAVITPRASMPGIVTSVSWSPPKRLTFEQWQACGRALSGVATTATWLIGAPWPSVSFVMAGAAKR